MIIRYSFKFKNFRISCSKIPNLDDKLKLKRSLILDTGAFCSLISLKSLIELELIDINSLDLLRDRLNKTNSYSIRKMRSASNHIIDCTPCVLKNIYLDGNLLKEFYFYLPLDIRLSSALLGLDFIRFCNFNKSSETKISVTSFDYNRYKANFIRELKNTSPIDLNLLCCVDEKDLAAYFRSYYKEV